MKAVLILVLCQAYVALGINEATLHFPMDSMYDDANMIGDGDTNLQMFNGAELRPGIKGNALYTDGINDYANLKDPRDKCIGSPDLCTDGFTLSAWLKIGMTQSLSDNRYYLSSGAQTEDSYGLAVLWQGTSMLFIVKTKTGNQYSVTGTAASDWRNWNQLTLSWSADNGLKVYLNGTLTGEAANPTRATARVIFNDFNFGKTNNGPQLHGEMLLDEFWWWNIEQPSEFISDWYTSFTVQPKFKTCTGNARYSHSRDKMVWADADNYCKSIGMALPHAATPEEAQELFDYQTLTGLDGYIWTGATDTADEGNYVYSDDGKPIDGAMWREGYEPNGDTKENCAIVASTTRKWADFVCTNPQLVICTDVQGNCPVVALNYLQTLC